MNTYQSANENISHETIQILKTTLMLERAYGVNYIVRLLQGDTRYPLRKIIHQQLETFGMLEGIFSSRIEDIVHYLCQQGYLRVTRPEYGIVETTERGESYLQAPFDIEVNRSELFRNWVQIELGKRLRTIRRAAAEAQQCPPYELFNNYVMGLLVRHMPASPVEMDQIPSMKDLDADVKAEVMRAIEEMHELAEQDEEKGGLYRKSFSPSHRKVKELFEAELTVEEIARRRKLQPSTVRQYLANLHHAGAIDLRPWIEREVDSQVLHAGSEYFRHAASPRLSEAHKVLGYDYDVLKLCKVYAGEVQEPVVKYAA